VQIDNIKAQQIKLDIHASVHKINNDEAEFRGRFLSDKLKLYAPELLHFQNYKANKSITSTAIKKYNI
jgi:hypothetical protein